MKTAHRAFAFYRSLVLAIIPFVFCSTSLAQLATPQDAEWVRKIGTPQYDETFGIAVDGTDIYVIARSSPGSYLTKLDRNGALVWEKPISVLLNTLAIDVYVFDGVVYVGGETHNYEPGLDPSEQLSSAFVMSLSTDGEVLNTVTEFEEIDGVSAVIANSSGIFIGGSTRFAQPVISRIDFDGTETWTRLLGQKQTWPTTALAIDEGRIYVPHYVNDLDYRVDVYDLNGDLIIIRAAENGVRDNGIAASQGATYIAGPGPNSGESVSAYDRFGRLLWSHPFIGVDGNAYAAKVNDGSLYVAGGVLVDRYGPQHALLMRYDLDGNLLWGRDFNVEGWATDVEIDSEGYVIVAGNSGTDVAGMPVEDVSDDVLDIFVAKVKVHPAGPIPAVRGEGRANMNWWDNALSREFTYPVVIIGPPTYEGAEPGVARIKNASAYNFKMRFEEWEYLQANDPNNTNHRRESMSYMVLEPGRHYLEDGSIWEVGSFVQEGMPNWTKHYFSQPFPGQPYLFASIQTSNGADAVTVRTRSISAIGFDAAMYEQESFTGGHTKERIGYLAIYNPNGTGTISMENQLVTYSLAAAKVNHGWVNVLGTEIKLEEEQSRDQETWHAFENVNVLTVHDSFFGHISSLKGRDTVVLRRR